MIGSWGRQGRLLTLCYHNVGPQIARQLSIRSLTVTTEQFASHLKWLKRVVDIIDPKDITSKLPARATLLTFDDGTRGLLQNALPALQAEKLSSVCFAAIRHHQQNKPYWWDLAEAGSGEKKPSEFERHLLSLRRQGSMLSADALSSWSNRIPEHLHPMSLTELKQWTQGGQYLGSHGNIHDPIENWTFEDYDPTELKTLAGDHFFPGVAIPYGEVPQSTDRLHFQLNQVRNSGIKWTFGTQAGVAPLSETSLMPRLLVASQWSLPRLLARIAKLEITGS